MLVCYVMASNDGEKLPQALQGEKVNITTADPGLEALVVAYRRAPSEMLRTQILSIYANNFKVSDLKALHRPFENLSDRRIKEARAHSSPGGPGIPVAKIPEHRVRLDKRQLDHFLEFTSLPYYYQDVAFGGRKLKLESEELVMPNIVRTISAKKKISVL